MAIDNTLNGLEYKFFSKTGRQGSVQARNEYFRSQGVNTNIPFPDLIRQLYGNKPVNEALYDYYRTAVDAFEILERFGTDSHIYLPGVGVINGLTAGNYIESALTTLVAVDDVVGGVKDATGAINATQGTTASKPIVRKGGNNYYWQFDGTNDSLALGAPLFQMADDHCVIAGGVLPTTGTGYVFLFVGGLAGGHAFSLAVNKADGKPIAEWGGTPYSAVTSAVSVGAAPFVLAASRVGNDKTLSVNGASQGTNAAATAGNTFTTSYIGVDKSGAGNFFPGSIYPVVAIKGTTTAAERLILSRWVGSLTGPTGVTI